MYVLGSIAGVSLVVAQLCTTVVVVAAGTIARVAFVVCVRDQLCCYM